MNEIKILKVLLRPEQIEIHYEGFSEAGGREAYWIVSTDVAAPSFYTNMASLKKHFVEVFDLPESWKYNRLTVIGLTVSYDGNLTEFSIIAEKVIRGFSEAMQLKTPKGIFTGQAAKDIAAVCRSAEEFVQGERAQMKISFTDKPKPAARKKSAIDTSSNQTH